MQKEEQLSLFPVGRKYWWLNDESLAVLNRGYLLHGETVEDAVKRITVRASEVLKKPELQTIFEEMIANGWLSLSSPIWANMGTKRGINIACFGSYVTDEIEGITDKLSEVIMQTKIGGGTSGYFGELRGRGASITNNGNSSGAVSFMELFNTAMNVVSQGCFTEDTEIFTNEGFKPIKEVVESKKYKLPTILQSIDKINLNELYWKDYEKPLEYFDYTYKDYLYSISFKKDGEIITLCTKDHKILLLKPNGEKLFITIEELEKDFNKYQNYYLGVQLEMSFHYYSLNLFIVKREDFYEGRVYCVETLNNILLAKYKNSTPLYIGNSTRRGSFAAYLDIDHPDIEEFLQIKDVGHPIQNLFYAVCVPDYWLHEMINGDSKKRDLWAKVLESRQHKGLPYIFFTDNVNKGKPEIYKYLDMKIHNSNLCSEIALPTSKDESFVCCLAAMNLELYDEWKDTKAVQYAIWFLDAVLSDFIENTKDQKHLQTARNFAIRHRAIGLGTLALHSYYQKIGRPFGHPLNIGLNNAIFSHIRSEAEKASRDLAREYGVAPIFKEVGPDFPESEKKRNTTLMTIMPTTSSSAILGQVSPGIEPYSSNYYKVDLAKGNFIRKNKYLKELLKSKGKDNDEVWSDIMIHQGSVQHLDFLTQDEKDIFKTFKEISQYDIIQQAATRQKHIDQSQSLNLNIPPSIPVKEVNKLILEAWKLGVKTLYYQRSQSVAKDLLTNLVTCSGCES